MTHVLSVAIEVDACYLPSEIEEWCVSNEVSTHYDPGHWCCDPSNEDDLLAAFVIECAKEEGFNMTPFTRADGCFTVYIDPT